MDNDDRATRLRDVGKICGKQGREIDITEYSKGFEAGTKTFCVPDNGGPIQISEVIEHKSIALDGD